MSSPVDDALDELYSVAPGEFTQVRKRLAAAAKKSGDADAARRIGAARKPTTAAYVVNALVLGGTAKSALADLGARLREAHAAMDGATIRALTAEQRRLVDDLARTALRQAGIASPPAALREDVTSTLQAAIADPEVAERLGRLSKAEQWSGFGDFGFSAAVSGGSGSREKTRAEQAPPKERSREARAAVAAAERARSEADAALGELQSDLARARLRRDDARRRLADAEQALADAEQALEAAEDAYAAGKQASRQAAEAVKAAKR
ncbi:hypothetical protein C6A87_027395 [Mycobacterium sp. ITM-2016-00317]|uniref:hypothetical protein n=1 Tax=Mycobacterium sp. ITM-2016-00317 TaxID=2099694 RepID=UPI00287F404B|nr:hypothetical protein [Mycobacterium sp. ITM-2016-00317]WNG87422.1 hypothetical protein C6A87_027395 [Mycobacterium sp. ITM-2016-00317]